MSTKIYIQTAEVSPITGQLSVSVVAIEAEVIELFGDWLLAKTSKGTILFPPQVILRVENPIFPEVEEGEKEDVQSIAQEGQG